MVIPSKYNKHVYALTRNEVESQQAAFYRFDIFNETFSFVDFSLYSREAWTVLIKRNAQLITDIL